MNGYTKKLDMLREEILSAIEECKLENRAVIAKIEDLMDKLDWQRGPRLSPSSKSNDLKYTYVTFGWDHVHNILGMIFNKKCIAAVPVSKDEKACQEYVDLLFKDKWSMRYDDFSCIRIDLFPNGVKYIDYSHEEYLDLLNNEKSLIEE